ncbi:MAG: hypothetical protein LBL62_10235, partial [Planctomycetaceae bacterium]|nr:hypothetical protein [Planctomycetaceae bacterium]
MNRINSGKLYCQPFGLPIFFDLRDNCFDDSAEGTFFSVPIYFPTSDHVNTFPSFVFLELKRQRGTCTEGRIDKFTQIDGRVIQN